MSVARRLSDTMQGPHCRRMNGSLRHVGPSSWLGIKPGGPALGTRALATGWPGGPLSQFWMLAWGLIQVNLFCPCVFGTQSPRKSRDQFQPVAHSQSASTFLVPSTQHSHSLTEVPTIASPVAQTGSAGSPTGAAGLTYPVLTSPHTTTNLVFTYVTTETEFTYVCQAHSLKYL